MTPSVSELTSQLQASIEVIRDAIRSPVTSDSHPIVADLFSEMLALKSTLQAELATSIDPDEAALTALHHAEELEPKFNNWAREIGTLTAPTVTAAIPVTSGLSNTTKKKKASFDFADIDWDAFSAPMAPSAPSVPAASAVPAAPVAATATGTAGSSGWPLKGQVKINLAWQDIGPLLLEDATASEEVRRRRLEEFFAQSLAGSLGIDPARIKASVTATS
jgi:hypothetical protein